MLRNFYNFILKHIFNDITASLPQLNCGNIDREAGYHEWLNSSPIDCAIEYSDKSGILKSNFITNMNKTFSTAKFDILVKKWLDEYFVKIFNILYDNFKICKGQELKLQDNSLNRYAVQIFQKRFPNQSGIKWVKEHNFLIRLFFMPFAIIFVFLLAVKNGITFAKKRKKFKIMREAVWGAHNLFRDDFFIDEKQIKKEDVIFFTRGSSEESRKTAYDDIAKLGYGSFNLKKNAISFKNIFSRILPKYVFSGAQSLLHEIGNPNYSLFMSIYLVFTAYALPYEKLFSNYEVKVELGHNYFSTGHISESIVCQNNNCRHYLTHWSDLSLDCNSFIDAFLSSDKYICWGKAHIRKTKDPDQIAYAGYLFKEFIKKVKEEKNIYIARMGLKENRKKVSFFAESFGGQCQMTGLHHLNFFRTAIQCAVENSDLDILWKPKEKYRYKNLAKEELLEYEKELEKIKSIKNFYVINEKEYSFIEVIGISDIVISQGMTSSAVIAIISGIEGLYLDEANYNHPFSKLFKNQIVFDNSEMLLKMIKKITQNQYSPLKVIPEEILSGYDAYRDEKVLYRIRSLLLS